MIAIIDYRAGNLKSVERSLKKLGCSCFVTQDPHEILNASKVIFPGVGAAGKAMLDLRHLGLDRALSEAFAAGKPILGICLGAQIILEKSEENATPCLGLMKGMVRAFSTPLVATAGGERLKIPHMGWNGIRLLRQHPVMEGVKRTDEFYFVHSYYPMPASEGQVIALSEHGIEFPSVIGCRNLVATQFHPEKSGHAGLRVLKNFCTWNGQHVE